MCGVGEADPPAQVDAAADLADDGLDQLPPLGAAEPACRTCPRTASRPSSSSNRPGSRARKRDVVGEGAGDGVEVAGGEPVDEAGRRRRGCSGLVGGRRFGADGAVEVMRPLYGRAPIGESVS